LKQRDIRRLKTAEMKLVRHTTEYSLLNNRRNENILEEFNIDTVIKKWLNHGKSKEDIRCPKQSLHYRPIGWSSLKVQFTYLLTYAMVQDN
jgi:hypothetical protein